MFRQKVLLGILAFALLVFVGQASAGPNANAVVLADIDASDNKMNDGNTSGSAVAGTDVVVEIFISGLAGPIVGGVVTFDTDKLTIKSATAATGFFALGTTANTASFGAVPSGTLTNDYFATITLTPAEGVMASTEFTVGISVNNLAPASNPTDTDNITAAMPLSFNSVQNRFSLSLDVDGSAGDQSVTSANVSTDEMVAIEIFGQDIRNANGLSVRFEYDAGQVTYDGFAAGDVLPNAQALPAQGTGFVEIGIASLGGQATANSGLVGTVRFRTTGGFSGTVIRLVRAELGRGGQIGSMTLDVRVELKLQVLTPDFNRDGRVNFADFLAFAGQYGARQGDGRYEAKYDLDSDGAIGFGDFLIFSSSYGQ